MDYPLNCCLAAEKKTLDFIFISSFAISILFSTLLPFIHPFSGFVIAFFAHSKAVSFVFLVNSFVALWLHIQSSNFDDEKKTEMCEWKRISDTRIEIGLRCMHTFSFWRIDENVQCNECLMAKWWKIYLQI